MFKEKENVEKYLNIIRSLMSELSVCIKYWRGGARSEKQEYFQRDFPLCFEHDRVQYGGIFIGSL